MEINEQEEKELEIVEDISTNSRQQDFWKAYLGSKSETYGNAYRSALKVGFSDHYSRAITGRLWFKSKMRRKSLLSKAERVLDKTLDMEAINEKGLPDAALARVQNDTAKFIAKTLGKDEGYTERAELTGKNGEQFVVIPPELIKKYSLSSEVETEDLKEDNKEL